MGDNFRHMIGMLFDDPVDEGVIVFAGKDVALQSRRELENTNEQPRTGFIFFRTGSGKDEFKVWAEMNLHQTMEIQFDRGNENGDVTFCPIGNEPVTFVNLLIHSKP